MSYAPRFTVYAHDVVKLCTVALIFLAFTTTANLVHDHYKQERERRLLVVFMSGGLPAVMARCILETETPEEIKDCVANSQPKKGIQL